MKTNNAENLFKKPNSRHILTVAFVIYLLVLSWEIIFKCNFLVGDLFFGYRSLTLIPFYILLNNGVGMNEFLIEVIGNLLAFIPFGILVALADKKINLPRASLYSAGLSLTFEVVQYIIALGSSDITDVIINTLGGMTGYFIYTLIRKKLTEKRVNIILLSLIAVGTVLFIYGVIDTALVFDKYFLSNL